MGQAVETSTAKDQGARDNQNNGCCWFCGNNSQALSSLDVQSLDGYIPVFEPEEVSEGI